MLLMTNIYKKMVEVVDILSTIKGRYGAIELNELAVEIGFGENKVLSMGLPNQHLTLNGYYMKESEKKGVKVADFGVIENIISSNYSWGREEYEDVLSHKVYCPVCTMKHKTFPAKCYSFVAQYKNRKEYFKFFAYVRHQRKKFLKEEILFSQKNKDGFFSRQLLHLYTDSKGDIKAVPWHELWKSIVDYEYTNGGY